MTTGIEVWPAAPEALRRRMAQVYGVDPAQVLPTRGATHAIELVFRLVSIDGYRSVAARRTRLTERLARISRLALVEEAVAGTGAIFLASPAEPFGEVLAAGEIRAMAEKAAPALLVVDESRVEFADGPSLAALTAEVGNLVVLRSLSFAYGLAGARCGAAIACADLVTWLEEVVEPFSLPQPTVAAAEAVLAPSRTLLVRSRIAMVKAERARMTRALKASPDIAAVTAGQGPFLFVVVRDVEAARRNLAAFGVRASWREQTEAGGFRLDVGAPQANELALAALGVEVADAPRRRAETVRDTRETRIAVTLDLDAPGVVEARTGVGFYDHMLEQVATHGGFAMTVACEGDLHIDPHHVVEDCALALGAALKSALGDKRGIGRFGFVLPMDEAQAQVSIDLGGRPFALFEGTFRDARIGDYPTEMTAHVFRSLADGLGAAIHVKVEGDNDHHKTEACFKALGRALRQAIRVEGSEVPSTKGVI
jgi:imidazoleglycerol phosphate dehydratase HisB/aspartate/methionine/tyrosine aminotransferase